MLPPGEYVPKELLNSKSMAKIGCRDCAGCSDCCQDMGQSIILDPFDIYRLTDHLGKSMQELMADAIELHVEDGLILPNLKMQEASTSCIFLNQAGRCSVHAFRPGLCRLFPLGRQYTDNRLEYFVLEDACPAKNKTKVRINKWLEMESLRDYEEYLILWHKLIKEMKSLVSELDDETNNQLNLNFLKFFYMKSYTSENFFSEVIGRIAYFKKEILDVVS